MKKLFVSYEIALKLKEKGFNEPCIATYTQETIGKGDRLQFFVQPINANDDFTFVSAPLYQQVEEWLFKEYNIFIEIKRIKVMADPEDSLYVYWCEVGDFSSQHYKMPKQALRKGIEEAIKLIK
jgi:hypothetical protein